MTRRALNKTDIGVVFNITIFSIFNFTINLPEFLGHVLQVEANTHVSNLAFAKNIMVMSSSSKDVLEAVNHHVYTVVMRINASNKNFVTHPWLTRPSRLA